ncbi:TPA: restriction endonuclease subunit S [Pseudomonas aeruginosa]|nr:restriction endonuclease subunit S [Pseudomonas aeruginosa]
MQSDASWKELNLGDVIELKRGYDLPKGKRSVGVIPIVSSSGISDFHSEAMVKGPGVVTGRYGTIGEVFYIDGDFWPLNTTLYVCDFKGSDPRFISYFLRTLDFQAYSDKGAVPGVNRNHLHTAKVRIPALPVQKAIARILEALDSKIDLNHRINQTLEAMAQAIFKSWFIDFDPVKARIAAIEQGQDPLRAAMRAISGKTDAELDQMPREHHDQLATTAALFPDAMEESELGEIPKGWKVVPASELIEFNPKEPLRKGTVAPYLDMASLPTSGSWAEPPTPREFGSGMRFRNGDALLARITPCLENGKSAFVQNLPDETVGWGSTEFIVMRSKKPVPQEYAYLLVRHAPFREHAIRSMTGTSGRQRAQVEAVEKFKITAPSENSTWLAFSGFVEPIFRVINAHAESSQTLAELRDTLLPKLLSGELHVSNTEKFLAGMEI